MTELNTNGIDNRHSPPIKGDGSYNLNAHTSSNMKLDRPKVNSADFNVALTNYSKFSHEEATKQLKAIDKDIYQRAKQEKEKHEFNFKRYFTIFGILGLLTAAIAYFRKGK